MSTELQINISEVKGSVPITVFQVIGEIDSHNYEILQEKATASYDGGSRHMLLDFSQLTFMSSAGLRAIHSIYKMLGEEEAGAKSTFLKLVNVPENIMKGIRAIGFDVYLEFFTDVDEAVASFS